MYSQGHLLLVYYSLQFKVKGKLLMIQLKTCVNHAVVFL